MDQSTTSLKGAKEDKQQMDRETVELYKQKTKMNVSQWEVPLVAMECHCS